MGLSHGSVKYNIPMRDFLAPVAPRIPPMMVRGQGSFVWDAAGRHYLDLNSGQFCAILGHSHPEVAEVVRRQACKLQNTSTTAISEEALDAAQKIHSITEDMDGRSVFLSTGAEANECCLQYAKHLTGRPGVISFEPAWHGLTLGTESFSISRRHVKPAISDTYPVPVPPVLDGADVPFAGFDGYVEAVANVVRQHGDRVAAAIFEPIVSSGGMYFPPAEYFQRAGHLPPSWNPADCQRVPDGLRGAAARGSLTNSLGSCPTPWSRQGNGTGLPGVRSDIRGRTGAARWFQDAALQLAPE